MEKKNNTKLGREIEDILLQGQNDLLIAYHDVRLLCIDYLSKLRVKVISQGFLNQKDEIYFFKVTKQLPLYNFIYYSELLIFESTFPSSNIKYQRKYIKNKLREFKSRLNKNKRFTQYIKLNENYLDSYYFTRQYLYKMDLSNWDNTNIYDPKFSTSHDTLFAKIRAYELFVVYLTNRMSNIKKSSCTQEYSLKWTSSKVSLTELVYALYHSNVINNGKADIKEIAKAFQNVFNVELGDLYHTFTEIRSRKKNRVKFLEELTFTLSNKIESNEGV